MLSLAALASADPASDVAKLDDLYARRDDAAALHELEASLNDAVRARPKDYEVLWRASRLKFWVADGATDPERKKDLGIEGWELGDRAIEADPGRVEGHYYAALGIGMYSQAVGVLRALAQGLERKYNERIDTAIKLDPSFNLGGPWVAKGRYHYELPWPKRDLAKSTEILSRSIEKYPQYLRAYLYLAEALLKDGKAERAKMVIDDALARSVAYDPPEGRRIQEAAKVVRVAVLR